MLHVSYLKYDYTTERHFAYVEYFSILKSANHSYMVRTIRAIFKYMQIIAAIKLLKNSKNYMVYSDN